jgi:hypothetical protein
MRIAINGAKAAAKIKKREVARAVTPTLFFLNLRQASWRGLLLVSTSRRAPRAEAGDVIYPTVDLLYADSNFFFRNICEFHP